jgi:malic enzyme
MAKPKKYEKTLYIRITKELKDKIEIAANKENVDPTDLVRKILETNKKLIVRDKQKTSNKKSPILYKPGTTEPFRLSSSRIELYQQCKKCEKGFGDPQYFLFL